MMYTKLALRSALKYACTASKMKETRGKGRKLIEVLTLFFHDCGFVFKFSCGSYLVGKGASGCSYSIISSSFSGASI